MHNSDVRKEVSHGVSVSFRSVSRSYGVVRAIDDVSLDVEAGEFVSLLGPSGSGKTTLLMMLAGFDQPTAGRMAVGSRDVTLVPANKRNIGMVFQRYALFPHMSVADNIAFPLRMRGMGRAERETKVRRALEMVKLAGYEARMPGQLSGGQQQRVALARAIVFDPPVVLMDEPLGALDKKLRQHLQIEIKQLQERLGATVIYVTHDQEEALTMSDRIAVLNHGRIVQLGHPQDLYNHPTNAFVADFLGEMNFIPGRLVDAEGGCCRVETAGALVTAGLPSGVSLQPGAKVRVAVRPERLAVALRIDGVLSPAASVLHGHVRQLVFNGASLAILISLDNGGAVLRADVNAQSVQADLRVGAPVAVTWRAADAHTYPEAA